MSWLPVLEMRYQKDNPAFHMKIFSPALTGILLFISLFITSISSAQTDQISLEGTWNINSADQNYKQSTFQGAAIDSVVFGKSNFTYYISTDSLDQVAGNYFYDQNELTLYFVEPTADAKRYTLDNLTNDLLVYSNATESFDFTRTTEPLDTLEETPAEQDFAVDPSKGFGFTFTSFYRGLIGIVFIIGLCFILSANKRKIDWKLVATGLGLQVLFAVLVLKVPAVAFVFDWISNKVVDFLNVSEAGADFVFGGLIDVNSSLGYIFAFKVLPTIVFFSAFTSLLYYLGILQKIVYGFAWVMSKTMRLSGSESLAAAANIFIGQTEAPLVVKPYLDKMTKSEMLCLMVGGMATIAGGVLAAFIAFLGGDSDAEKIIFTKHLLTASIMSAPAAIIIAKILFPEENKDDINTDLDISQEKIGSNVLDAISRGTTDGLKLAVNVGAMLLVFTAIMAVVNWMLGDLIGDPTGLNDKIVQWTDGRYQSFSMQYILGNLFAPVAWLIGVPYEDIIAVGQLLGEKTILNEFFAYASLSTLKNTGVLVNYRSIVIATYALCGFANFASIGIQIGGIGVLAPSQRGVLAKFGIKALIGGTCAALLTATIAGMLFG
ncbi:concentrative nucleoside transporter, CNT family [Nonlabens sp. Hel1_33_55]|uniref:NupC/NupG family nucleoside CNT transporter n=1 Tax=Nonlabens sp. Hel1_33_55 TaxID=1336802 RepID=UPI000875DF1C|nr:nucleoside transporter C-terminal domain-containing protein [Nonlabens sp. Hel1_33_55]SCY27345.1 concentrative nucleoside transporter, CNT family [Nonlabens sp. Hel1_33_55]